MVFKVCQSDFFVKFVALAKFEFSFSGHSTATACWNLLAACMNAVLSVACLCFKFLLSFIQFVVLLHTAKLISVVSCLTAFNSYIESFSLESALLCSPCKCVKDGVSLFNCLLIFTGIVSLVKLVFFPLPLDAVHGLEYILVFKNFVFSYKQFYNC